MNFLTSTPSYIRRRAIPPINLYIAALVVPSILAASGPQQKLAAGYRLTVCVNKDAGVEPRVLERGELSAGKILASVGLEIDWLNEPCSCPPEQDAIVLNVTTNTPEDYLPGAYGMSLPFEGIHVRAFYGRIQRVRPDQVVPLLGHVLAHEIVHVLSGNDSHSETGIMKRRWNLKDLEQMVIHPLPFSTFDISLLKLGIRDRHARLVSMRNHETASMAELPGE